ncbi:MAG TPA: S49 family peptidase, partial [Pirellulales bacterium]|nr:S49 family peptidase [Pirellulales bacterium]
MSPLPSHSNPSGASDPAAAPFLYGAQATPVRVIVSHRGISRWLWWLGWAAFVVVLVLYLQSRAANQTYLQTDPPIQERYHSLDPRGADKVAIIDVEGTIMHSDGFIKWQIDRVRADQDVKAVVLRIDSPGGTVTGSDYLYHQLLKLKEDRKIPLVVSMGGIAASGGYYIAMAVGDTHDAIFAEPTTWTGS